MFVVPKVAAEGQVRDFLGGDILGGYESVAALTTAGSGSITAAIMVRGAVDRTGPGIGYTDTFDTAANLCAALAGSGSLVTAGVTFQDLSIQSGVPMANSTFRFLFMNGVAQAMTAAVGVGGTLGANVNVAASLWREYLVTITNSTPVQSASLSTTNASPTITGATTQLLQKISIGQLITGTGAGAGALVSSINFATNVITASVNSTATGTAVLTFSPTYTIRGLRSGTA